MSVRKRVWSVKFYGNDAVGSGVTVVGPGGLLRALAYLLFVPSQDGYVKRQLVDYDEEMRSWGRFDWVQNPTETDKRLASEMAHRVIPGVEPGAPIRLVVPVGARSSCEFFPGEAGDAK